MSLYCKLFGHKFIVSKKVTKHVNEYTCTSCNKQLTTSGNGNLVELTSNYKEINSVLSHIYYKRQTKRLSIKNKV